MIQNNNNGVNEIEVIEHQVNAMAKVNIGISSGRPQFLGFGDVVSFLQRGGDSRGAPEIQRLPSQNRSLQSALFNAC